MRGVPARRNLRDVDFIEWDTGGDCYLGLPAQMICSAFRLGSEDIISPRLGLVDRRSLETLF